MHDECHGALASLLINLAHSRFNGKKRFGPHERTAGMHPIDSLLAAEYAEKAKNNKNGEVLR